MPFDVVAVSFSLGSVWTWQCKVPTLIQIQRAWPETRYKEIIHLGCQGCREQPWCRPATEGPRDMTHVHCDVSRPVVLQECSWGKSRFLRLPSTVACAKRTAFFLSHVYVGATRMRSTVWDRLVQQNFLQGRTVLHLCCPLVHHPAERLLRGKSLLPEERPFLSPGSQRAVICLQIQFSCPQVDTHLSILP